MDIRHLAVVVVTGLTLGATAGTNAQQSRADRDSDRAPFLNSYVGRYQITDRFFLDITRVGDALYAQTTGQKPAQLRPRSETEFVIVGSSLRLIFSVDPVTGAVDHLVFEQGGFGRRAERLEASMLPAARQALVLGAAALSRYVGTYEEQPGFAITVRLVDGSLVAGLTGQELELIVPETEREFFYEHSTARLSFDLTDDGPATGVTLRHGGSNVAMTRLDD